MEGGGGFSTRFLAFCTHTLGRVSVQKGSSTVCNINKYNLRVSGSYPLITLGRVYLPTTRNQCACCCPPSEIHWVTKHPRQVYMAVM